MNDYAFFEYRAKVFPASHAEEEGEPVHCLIKMKTVTDHGRHQRSVVELEQDACDLVLFTLHPGPYRKIGRSSIWEVDEAQMPKQSQEAGCTRVGDCAIYFC
jgi:hypothetical protein